jgi:hypothetical protein
MVSRAMCCVATREVKTVANCRGGLHLTFFYRQIYLTLLFLQPLSGPYLIGRFNVQTHLT